MARIDGRRNDQLRDCKITTNFLHHAAGSAVIEHGKTRVLCAVSAVAGVPRWMKEQKVPGGWVTGEYQMLPASTSGRTSRDINRGRLNGRAQEIQRLIGRCMRAAVDLAKLDGYTLYIDCDVLDADGGTRCASINGAWVALNLAVNRLLAERKIAKNPICESIAAISVGIVDGTPMTDLCYHEDAAADVDMNVVMTGGGEFIELQGTAESGSFSRKQMLDLTALAESGITDILALQRDSLAG